MTFEHGHPSRHGKILLAAVIWEHLLLGICFLRGALEGAVEGIGDGEKGGCGGKRGGT